MKLFFKLLLATNILFFLIIWFYPIEPKTPKTLAVPDSKKMQLLAELGQEKVQAQGDSNLELNAELNLNSNQADEEAKTELSLAQSSQEPDEPIEQAASTLCYTLGPFKKESRAKQVSNRSDEQGIEMRTRKSTEREYMGLLVYLSGHKNRKEVQETANQLARKGIKDFIVINEEDKPNSLSLGVFGLKKNATRRINLISKLGYKALTEPRYRQRDIYWLDYKTDNDTLNQGLLTAEDESRGISQISRQCPS